MADLKIVARGGKRVSKDAGEPPRTDAGSVKDAAIAQAEWRHELLAGIQATLTNTQEVLAKLILTDGAEQELEPAEILANGPYAAKWAGEVWRALDCARRAELHLIRSCGRLDRELFKLRGVRKAGK